MDVFDLLILGELSAGNLEEQWWLDEEHEGKPRKRSHGGSRPGRRPNKKRNYAGRYKRLVKQYFSDEPTYDGTDFRRRFRMSERLFSRVYTGVLRTDPAYFEQRKNCAGKLGIHPLLKIAAALRVLAYAPSVDSLDDNFEIGESTMFKTLCRFLDAIIEMFGTEYLRAPTPADVERLLTVNARRGFVNARRGQSMLCCIDCMHWEWQNCPASLAGQFKGKEKKPTVVLEACADQDLWIWHASVGWPGSLNDINVLDRSHFFDRILRGEAPQVNFVVNNHRYDMAYCLADGIYPDWPVFLKTISEPQGNKRKRYAAAQEACRKDVERAFGVLQARWRIINSPSKFWRRQDMAQIMKTCIILHNMIVEDERETSTDDDNLWEGEKPQPFVVSRPPGRVGQGLDATIRTIRKIEDNKKYFQLRDDMVEHLWQLHADADD